MLKVNKLYTIYPFYLDSSFKKMNKNKTKQIMTLNQ